MSSTSSPYAITRVFYIIGASGSSLRCFAVLHKLINRTNNFHILSFAHNSRVYTSIAAGFVAGILGLTNIIGFLAYFVAMMLVR